MLGSIGHDLLHVAFHFEGRIFHTLPLLVRDPGRLTRRHIVGGRARFVSPLALFLFSVFLMFAALHVMEGRRGPGAPHRRATQAAQVARIDAVVVRQRAAFARAQADPLAAPSKAEAIAGRQAALASRAGAAGGAARNSQTCPIT